MIDVGKRDEIVLVQDPVVLFFDNWFLPLNPVEYGLMVVFQGRAEYFQLTVFQE
jgi:hypothetical protein